VARVGESSPVSDEMTSSDAAAAAAAERMMLNLETRERRTLAFN